MTTLSLALDNAHIDLQQAISICECAIIATTSLKHNTPETFQLRHYQAQLKEVANEVEPFVYAENPAINIDEIRLLVKKLESTMESISFYFNDVNVSAQPKFADNKCLHTHVVNTFHAASDITSKAKKELSGALQLRQEAA